jgi:antitoxin Phd
MKTWQLQEAKNKFSALIDKTLKEGVQFVSRRGTKVVAIVPIDIFESKFSDKSGFIDFLLTSPKCELEVDRANEAPRKVDL